jgi:hypothetical protein
MVAQVCPKVLVSWAHCKDVPFVLENRPIGFSTNGNCWRSSTSWLQTEFATSAPPLAQGGFVVGHSESEFRCLSPHVIVSGSFDVQAVTT